MKVAVVPAFTVVEVGFEVTDGEACTVKVAAEEATDPTELVKTAWYWLPLLDTGTLLRAKVFDVAPGMFENDVPPSVLTVVIRH